jgi:membrane peptidoglycan carboxypeptidase
MKVKNRRNVTRKRPSKGFNLRAMNPSKIGSSYGKYKAGKKSRVNASKKAKMKKLVSKVVLITLGIFFFLFVGALIAGGLYLKNIEKSLPSPDKLVDRDSDQSTVILDRHGRELYKIYGDKNREFVSLDSLPDHLKWAILSAEDIEFYNHKGLDLMAVMRAAYANVVLKRVARGASTISQQLVKNTILFDVLGDEVYEQTYSRKIKEALITMQVEQTLTKDQILQMYINEIPFGGVNYGIQSAALAYFGKDAKDLTLAESAMLAGVIASPTNFSPIFGSDPELAVRRQHIVLDSMLKNKNVTGVTKDEIEEAKEEELVYASREIDIDAPHFVFYVKQELEKMYDIQHVERGGLRVTTTLDYSIQEIAEEEIRQGIAQYGYRWGVQNGAMVVVDPHTNQILAMVGSIDYWGTEDPRIDGNVNVVTRLRQMGSSMKPYTYLTAFNQGYGPWLQTPDINAFNFGDYKLQNWDQTYYGPMNARQALLQSRNIPAVYTTQLIGVDAFIETAEKLGVTSLTDRDRYGLSITLGAAEVSLLEHTGAFSVFATGGLKRPIASILEVKNAKDETIYEYEVTEGERVFDEKEIYALNWILCDLGGFGDQPQNHLYFVDGRRALCGKTGTTDGPKDLTSIIYHRNLVVAVWAGNNNNEAVPGAWSTTIPLPIAHSFVQRVSTQYIPEFFARPAGIVATSVCRDTGRMASANDNCDKVPSIYIAGKLPPQDEREIVKVCKDSGLISTNPDIAAQFDLLEDRILMRNYALENPLQSEAYKIYLASREGMKIIFDEVGSADCALPAGAMVDPTVSIVSPKNNANVKPDEKILISLNVKAGMEIERVEVYFDGALIPNGILSAGPYNVEYRLPKNLTIGTHTISVKVFDRNGKTVSTSTEVKYVAAEVQGEKTEEPTP